MAVAAFFPMDRMTLRFLAAICATVFLTATPVLAQHPPEALLVVADDGGLEVPALHAIRNVAASELRRRGIGVSEDRRTAGVHDVDDALAMLASDLGVRRVFALRVGGRLGQKVPLAIDELDVETLAPVHSASLTAMDLEECDVVTARLVDAVLGRRSAESNAQMTTVTAVESKPFAKKPGERFWFVGLPIGLYNAGTSPAGFSLGYGYEAENFRLSVTGAGFSRGNDGVGYVAMEVAFIPFATEFSPYVGGGVGYMGAGNRAGIGGIAEAGLEAFRLHGVRALAGVQVAIPFFETEESASTPGAHRSAYPAAFLRMAF